MCVVVHWHCSAQLSMFNMEKRYRNRIIIIIINVKVEVSVRLLLFSFFFLRSPAISLGFTTFG